VILLDTNILLRLLWRDDTAQLGAIERHLEKSREKAQVHTLTIAETVWMLQRKAWSRADIVDALLEVCASRHFEVIDEDIVKIALEIYFEGRVSFVDAFQAAYVTRQGLQGILSFDRDYDDLGIKRIEPNLD
jgi:predicted nucleic-acid-binding protein